MGFPLPVLFLANPHNNPIRLPTHFYSVWHCAYCINNLVRKPVKLPLMIRQQYSILTCVCRMHKYSQDFLKPRSPPLLEVSRIGAPVQAMTCIPMVVSILNGEMGCTW